MHQINRINYYEKIKKARENKLDVNHLEKQNKSKVNINT
jgi:hypothetical protein